MQTKGKLIEKLLEVSGENVNGYWIRGGFVIESGDAKTPMAFEVSGTDRVAMVRQMQMGEDLVVEWRPACRKFNDKWFVSLHCFGVMRLGLGESKK